MASYVITRYDIFMRKKGRDVRSQAVIDLRGKMGITQQTLAVEYMHSAITTVARWESSHPPRGEALIRLAELAKKHRHMEICRIFLAAYLQQVLGCMSKPLYVEAIALVAVVHGLD